MSDLAITYDSLRQRIAEEFGYRRTIANWSDDQKEDIENRLMEGLQEFYRHDWSFKKPVRSFTIVSGSTELVLPSEFGFPVGDIYFEDEVGGEPLKIQNIGRVLHLRQMDGNSSARPQFAALDERGPGETHGQRKYLVFWPTADAAYRITMQFDICGEALSTTNPHPYGGTFHHKTIRESCLAAVEQYKGELGVHTQLYAAALELSKDYDRKVKAQTLGYNGNGSGRLSPQPGRVTYTSNL